MKVSKNFNKKFLLFALVAAIETMSSASVFASTESGTLTVSETLISGCAGANSVLDSGDSVSSQLSADDFLGVYGQYTKHLPAVMAQTP